MHTEESWCPCQRFNTVMTGYTTATCGGLSGLSESLGWKGLGNRIEYSVALSRTGIVDTRLAIPMRRGQYFDAAATRVEMLTTLGPSRQFSGVFPRPKDAC